jgi:hypothetical protein
MVVDWDYFNKKTKEFSEFHRDKESVENDCLVENFISKLPPNKKNQPVSIYCPCKRCSPHSYG